MKPSETLKKIWEEAGWEGGQGTWSRATLFLEDAWQFVIPVIEVAEKIDAAGAEGQPGSLINNLRLALGALENELGEYERGT